MEEICTIFLGIISFLANSSGLNYIICNCCVPHKPKTVAHMCDMIINECSMVKFRFAPDEMLKKKKKTKPTSVLKVTEVLPVYGKCALETNTSKLDT